MMYRIFIVLFSVFLVTGCSAKYTCSGFPDSTCQPVSATYQDTNNGIDDYRQDFYKNQGDGKKSTETDVTINIQPNNTQVSLVKPGEPILSKPVILRVLMNQWEDKEKDLNAGGYVFIRLKEPEWILE